MSAPAKPTESNTQPTTARGRRDADQSAADRSTAADGSADQRRDERPDGQLEELVRAREDLTAELRELVARRALEDAEGPSDHEAADRLVLRARAELLEQLRHQEQEQARRQLAAATRSSEDAVAGVVQSVSTLVRSVVPTVLVRPEDFIEASFALAEQSLRVGRRIALAVTENARILNPAA